MRRPTGGVEVNCLTLLAGEATLDSVALYDGPKVLGEVNCWIFEASIVDRNYSTSIVDKALQCLSHDETLRVRLVSVGERTVCGKENSSTTLLNLPKIHQVIGDGHPPMLVGIVQGPVDAVMR